MERGELLFEVFFRNGDGDVGGGLVGWGWEGEVGWVDEVEWVGRWQWHLDCGVAVCMVIDMYKRQLNQTNDISSDKSVKSSTDKNTTPISALLRHKSFLSLPYPLITQCTPNKEKIPLAQQRINHRISPRSCLFKGPIMPRRLDRKPRTDYESEKERRK